MKDYHTKVNCFPTQHNEQVEFEIKNMILEDITIINIYAPNMGAPQYVRQMLTSMKGEINNNTIIKKKTAHYGNY